TPMTLDTPVSDALSPGNETDAYRFTAAAGTRVFFDVQARSGAGSAQWAVYDPFGNTVFDRDFNSASSDVGPVTLGVAGTYTVLLEGSRFDAGGVGSYTFAVNSVSDEAFAL